MKIAYLAHHRPGDWDEGSAISYALEQLGHTVLRFRESELSDHLYGNMVSGCDFLLFHHFNRWDILDRITIPKVFWNFDLVEYPNDYQLAKRNRGRLEWFAQATPRVLCGFCNDGDFVAKDRTGKLSVLKEGIDSRYAGKGVADPRLPPIDILFVGSSTGGDGRRGFVSEMRDSWAGQFVHVGENPPFIWTRELANLIARAKIVVAPDHPITNRYWSNRVYVTLGFGGFLIHPYCWGVIDHYASIFGDLSPGVGPFVIYRDRADLKKQIHTFLHPKNAKVRQQVSERGMLYTLSNHTFLHRCAQLIRRVGEML